MEVLLSLALFSTHYVMASNTFRFSYLLDLYNTGWSQRPELHRAVQVQRLFIQSAALPCSYSFLPLLYRLERPIASLSHCKWALYYHAQPISQSGSQVSSLLAISSSSPPCWPWAGQVGVMLPGYPGRRAHGPFQTNYRNLF